MLHRRGLIIGVGAVAISGAARATEVEKDDAIRDILGRRVDVQKQTVGIAVSVVAPSRHSFVSWGSQTVGSNRPITSETVFEIGSITKVFTALLLADMSRKGMVGLDDPVVILPVGFRLPAIGGREITLADLATHTSGLPTFPHFTGTPLSPAWLTAMAQFSVDDFKVWLADFRPQRLAGAGWEYSNAGYALLGMALANRCGEPYEAALRVRVIEPMGLQETTFQPTDAMQSRLAEGHDASLKPLPPIELGIFVAAGGLLSTPSDMSKFADTIWSGSGGQLSPEERLMLAILRPAPPIGGQQALGWEVIDAPGGAFNSKDGVTWGQTASLVFDRVSRTAIIAMTNTAPHFRKTDTSPSGGGFGAADIARHLLRPSIPLG